jgi:hypothetical protein
VRPLARNSCLGGGIEFLVCLARANPGGNGIMSVELLFTVLKIQ